MYCYDLQATTHESCPRVVVTHKKRLTKWKLFELVEQALKAWYVAHETRDPWGRGSLESAFYCFRSDPKPTFEDCLRGVGLVPLRFEKRLSLCGYARPHGDELWYKGEYHTTRMMRALEEALPLRLWDEKHPMHQVTRAAKEITYSPRGSDAEYRICEADLLHIYDRMIDSREFFDIRELAFKIKAVFNPKMSYKHPPEKPFFVLARKAIKGLQERGAVRYDQLTKCWFWRTPE